MTWRQVFLRKIGYLVGIAVLLGLLAWLGTPPAPSVDREKSSPGGLLAQVREKAGLTPSQLGELDAGGEAVQLATLGMRGVAVHILWTKAENYKKKKDWTNLSASLEQMAKLEPHFITVWRHQGWNLSYNVSVEFDDYRERFRWILRGIEFLKTGIRYNQREPLLYGDTAWIYAQKIGRADEVKLFRRLFMDPNDPYEIHGGRPPRDNWLVGKDWYAEAEKLVDEGAILRTTPLIFFSHRPMCQMNYSDAIEKEGTFGDTAMQAWETALREFRDEFGRRELPSGYDFAPFIRLEEEERVRTEIEELARQIDALQPGLREEMLAERRADLTPEELSAVMTPADQRTPLQRQIAAAMQLTKLRMTHEQVARRIRDPERRKEALELARKAVALERTADAIAHNRNIVNYTYWRRHAEVEQTPDAVAARELMYRSEEAYQQNDHITAQELFYEAARKWREVLEKNPDLQYDDFVVNDLAEFVNRYMKILDQLDTVFSPDFALQSVVRRYVRNLAAHETLTRLVDRAKQEVEKGDYAAARRDLEEAFREWSNVLDRAASLRLLSDRETVQEIMDMTALYDQVLQALNDTFPGQMAVADVIRIQIAQTPPMKRIKQDMAQANYLLLQSTAPAQLQAARALFEDALPLAADILKQFPHLTRLSERKTVQELLELHENYRRLLATLNEPLPEDYPLRDFAEKVIPLIQRESAGSVSPTGDSRPNGGNS